MTERTPPAWLQSGSYPAEDDRRLVATLFADTEGIVLSGDLVVTQRGAGANMSVDVAGGRCVIKGDLSTYEGSYFMENRGTTNLVIAASDPTNPRVDLIVAEVLNAEYSGASNLWRLRVVTGTPAAVPATPTLPDNCISLAEVDVAALAASITNANITDTRSRTSGLGGMIVCTSSTRPSAPFEGMMIYETDTDRSLIYTGSSWLNVSQLASWPTWTPTLVQTGAVAKTVAEASYEIVGKRCTGHATLLVTGAGTIGTPIVIGLPIDSAYNGNLCIGSGWVYDASAVTGYGGPLIRGGASTCVIWAHNQTNNVGKTPSFALANGDQISINFSYRVA